MHTYWWKENFKILKSHVNQKNTKAAAKIHDNMQNGLTLA